MSPFQNLQKLTAILLLHFFLLTSVCGQQIIFSDSLGSYANVNFSSISGKINHTIIVTESLPDNPPKIFLFDTACGLIKSKELSFIPPGGYLKTTVIEESNSCNILWQSIHGGYWYLHKTYFSGADTIISRTASLDSSLLPATIKLHPYYIAESPNHQYQLLFNKIPDYENNQLLIHLIIITAQTGKVNKGQLVIPFNNELDINRNVVIDDHANVFTVVYDQPFNYKLNAAIHLYQYTVNGEQVNFAPLIAKEKKPVNIQIQSDVTDNSIQLMSLYVDFISKNINGIMSAVFSAKGERKPELYFYTFSNEIKKELGKYIANLPNNKLMNYLELNQFLNTGNKKNITVLLELWHSTHSRYDIGNSYVSNINADRIYFNSNPYDAIKDSAQLRASLPKIPVEHVSFLASFDRKLNLLQNKILQAEVRVEYDFIGPLNFLSNDTLSRFYYAGTATKLKLKSTLSSAPFNIVKATTQQLKPGFFLLLNHPSFLIKDNLLFTFYRNKKNNAYGLAKVSR